MSAPRLGELSEGTLRALRERLVSSGYDGHAIAAGEAILPRQFDAIRLPLVHRALRKDHSPGARLLRLFTYDDALAESEAREALGAELIASLAAADLLEVAGEQVRSRVRIVPFERDHIIADPPHAPDPVMAPGPTTLQLARCLDDDLSGRRVLDLGAGPGTLALLARGRGASVAIATDIDPRAAEYARANAMLNGLALDARCGDLDAPVRGEQFDLVLCQPPFVPHPEGVDSTTYLHGGARGDELALRALAAIPALLAPGGRALLRIDLPGGPEAAWERLASALASLDRISVIAYVAPGPPADELASAYAASAVTSLDAEFAGLVRRYRDHLDALEITRMTGFTLELVNDGKGARARLPVRSLGGVSPALRAGFRRNLELATATDDALLAMPLTPPPGTTLVTQLVLGTERPKYSLRATDLLETEISEPVALLVDVLGRGATLEEAADALARAMDEDPIKVARLTLGFARDALKSGLLLASV